MNRYIEDLLRARQARHSQSNFHSPSQQQQAQFQHFQQQMDAAPPQTTVEAKPPPKDITARVVVVAKRDLGSSPQALLPVRVDENG